MNAVAAAANFPLGKLFGRDACLDLKLIAQAA